MTVERPRIFYFCHRHNHPRGGQKHTYRHVDILNGHGWQAWAFHPGEGFRLTWFANQTAVLSESAFHTAFRPGQDIVVLPEDLGPAIIDFPGPKVIFNKNLFTGMQALGVPDALGFDPYFCSDLLGVFAVSDHNRAHLQLAYPHLRVLRVDVEIDTALFQHRSLADKAPLIALSPKVPEQVLALYHLARARGEQGLNRAKEFSWSFLQGMSEAELAEVLNAALVLVNFSNSEGIGRLPLEAMASGCLMLSCRNGPLATQLPLAEEWPVADLISPIHWLERVMEAWPDNLDPWTPLSERGVQIARQFSPANQAVGVLAAWEKLIEGMRR
jgi:hypothetical protein